jgi:hypothetical protein
VTSWRWSFQRSSPTWNRPHDPGRSFAEFGRLLKQQHLNKAELNDAFGDWFDEIIAGPIACTVEILRLGIHGVQFAKSDALRRNSSARSCSDNSDPTAARAPGAELVARATIIPIGTYTMIVKQKSLCARLMAADHQATEIHFDSFSYIRLTSPREWESSRQRETPQGARLSLAGPLPKTGFQHG